MHIKLVSIALLSISILSCTPNESTEEAKAAERAELLKDPEGVKQTKPDLLATVPFKKVPVVDSTNFDNFNGEDKLSKKLVSKLQLKSIDPNYQNFHSRYRIALSTDIDLLVVTLAAENELKTFLISYRKDDYELIDKVMISYDEIAESAFRSVGKITNDGIVVTNYNYMGEEPVVDVKKYRIDKTTGKFLLKS
ncbi:hypothetical protein [Fluviicola taffensis]|uniref:hypothetical protein n=1 Tax=Fluviicola taffensis TaxID=191579 RepID=UPI0031384556